MNVSADMFQLGYDYLLHTKGLKIPLYAPIGHLICVGASNSGKSTALLYWIYKMHTFRCEIWIADFKRSQEFSGISKHFAEFENCYNLIIDFYKMFQDTPEGGKGIKILIIDEIAGLLTHFGLTKEGKAKADEVRMVMSLLLMTGRSRNCFLWLSLQRYTSTIFPSSSGAADSFYICAGLGRLTVDGRKGLFAGETFDGEEELMFGQGKGIVLMDGQPLKSLILPILSKPRILELLQQ